VADALSRRKHFDEEHANVAKEVMMVGELRLQWLEDVKSSYEGDSHCF
jgi:hypothetical protein